MNWLIFSFVFRIVEILFFFSIPFLLSYAHEVSLFFIKFSFSIFFDVQNRRTFWVYIFKIKIQTIIESEDSFHF